MKLILTTILTFVLIGCQDNQKMYTLYRNGLDLKNPDKVDESARFYIATFNEPTDLKYNQANCMLTAEALNKHQIHYQNSIYSKIRINYWCEKGTFKN
jgi:hypothetical protein